MQQGMQKRLSKKLAQNHACYVLITCDEATKDGRMQVEMTYEGDPVLAAYLLQEAQSFIHADDPDEKSKFLSLDKIVSSQI